MSIVIKNLTLKNFLSIGQVTQAVDFNRRDLTLILGENLDLGGDGARNGTGKTTIIQGLSYALFGTAINQIKKDNLINRTNGKGMVATVEFTASGREYKVVRGRKPNILKFYIDGKEQEQDDNSQGDSRETQDAIERVLDMTPDMFRQIVALNTYNEPFLAMKVADQRTIIEQLLGITLLSEKAEAIKELNKATKDDILKEEFRIRGVEEANRKIGEQIDSLKKRQKLWTAKRDEDLATLTGSWTELQKVDIAAELAAHRALAEWVRVKAIHDTHTALVARQTAWRQKRDREAADLQTSLDALGGVDISTELAAHRALAEYNIAVAALSEYTTAVSRLNRDLEKERKNLSKLTAEVAALEDHKCYACGQDLHDSSHSEVLDKKSAAKAESAGLIEEYTRELQALEASKPILPAKPTTVYKTEAEAIKHSSELANLQDKIRAKLEEVDPYLDQLAEVAPLLTPLGPVPKTVYDTEAEAMEHQGKVKNVEDQLSRRAAEVDPYAEQIQEMATSGLEQVDYTELNRLTRVLQHQDYLLDLLTNKKSFVRKRIIEQNLSYLNTRLGHYLDRMGLPHQVVFQNDLSVEITELGRETDFDALSRGERNRVIVGLSLAFRDVWESLYNPINLLFVDELIDNGMDTVGVENGIALLKHMVRNRNKSVWLVSHRDELSGRVDNIVKVVKESGFTSIYREG